MLGVYGPYTAHKVSDQAPEEVVARLKQLNEANAYPQRETDLAILALGESTGVRSTIVMLPMLYGLGQGLFNNLTGQATMLIREAVKDGYVSLVGNGDGVKNYVHIEDAANFFEIIVSRILEGAELPYGVQGIHFVESGSLSWREIVKGIADAGSSLGHCSSREPRELSLQDAVSKLDWKNPWYTELAFVSR